jgi:hypothetical protein
MHIAIYIHQTDMPATRTTYRRRQSRPHRHLHGLLKHMHSHIYRVTINRKTHNHMHIATHTHRVNMPKTRTTYQRRWSRSHRHLRGLLKYNHI